MPRSKRVYPIIREYDVTIVHNTGKTELHKVHAFDYHQALRKAYDMLKGLGLFGVAEVYSVNNSH